MTGDWKSLVIVIWCCCTSLSTAVDRLCCQDIENGIQIKDEITSGRVKRIYRGLYQDHLVVVSYPADEEMKVDFEHGLQMLINFQLSGFVTELYCCCLEKESLKMVTKYYKHGSLDDIDQVLKKFDSDEHWSKRLQLVEDYLSVMEFLHENSRVMCDSNDLTKTLSQFLITDDFRLIVNDLDALPEVLPNATIKCGHRQLFGEFVAPEQLWSHVDRPFSDVEMEGYDEKTDIWKIPNVLVFLLGRSTKATQTKMKLFDLFGRCKNLEPSQRPTAKEVKLYFQKIVASMKSKIEL